MESHFPDSSVWSSYISKKIIKIASGNFKFVNGCFDLKKDVLKNKVIVNIHCCPLDVSLSGETIKVRDGSSQLKWAIFNAKN